MDRRLTGVMLAHLLPQSRCIRMAGVCGTRLHACTHAHMHVNTYDYIRDMYICVCVCTDFVLIFKIHLGRDYLFETYVFMIYRDFEGVNLKEKMKLV